MSKTIRNILLGIWTVVATLAATRWWITYPDMIPRLPEAFWLRLIEIAGSRDGDDLANLELAVALVLSFLLVATITLILAVMLRRIRRR